MLLLGTQQNLFILLNQKDKTPGATQCARWASAEQAQQDKLMSNAPPRLYALCHNCVTPAWAEHKDNSDQRP
jgi:hypothetical protein